MIALAEKGYFMRIYKNKAFNKWATKEGLSDDALT
jgi:hypothetical protein